MPSRVNMETASCKVISLFGILNGPDRGKLEEHVDAVVLAAGFEEC